MRLRPGPVTTLAILSVFATAMLPLVAGLDSFGWAIPVATAAFAAVICSVAIESRWPNRSVPLLAPVTAVGAYFWCLVFVYGASFAADPFSPAVWRQVVDGVLHGWTALLNSDSPTADLAAAEALLVVLTWSCIAGALHVAARWHSSLGAIVLGAAMLWVTAATTLDTPAWLLFSGGAVGAAALFAFASTTPREGNRWSIGRWVGLFIMSMSAALGGGALVSLTQSLQPEPFDPRSTQPVVLESLEVPNLLTEFSTRQSGNRVMFTAESLGGQPSGANWFRLQVLSTYDGVQFSPDGQFTQIDGFTQPDAGLFGDPVNLTITIRGLALPFMPVTNQTISLNADGFGWDRAMTTALRSGPVTTYRVSGSDVVGTPLDGLSVASTEENEVYLELPAGLPDVIRTQARSIVNTSVNDAIAVERITEFVRSLGRDDAVPSGHSLGRLERQLNDQSAGAPEQLAVLHALLLRAGGYPSRVVVGYVSDDLEVTASELHTWVEVPFDGVGWVPFEPTPRSAEPSATQDPTVPTTTTPDLSLAAQEQPRELGAGEDEEFEEAQEAVLTLGDLVPLTLLALVITFFAIVGSKAVRRIRRRASRSPAHQVLGAWAELLDRLRENGVKVPAAAVVNQIVDYTTNVNPAGQEAVTALAELVNTSLHSHSEPAHDAGVTAWNYLREIEGAMAQAGRPRFWFGRVFGARSLSSRAPTPPPDRDGGWRTMFITEQ